MTNTFSFKIEVFTNGLVIFGTYDLPFYRRLSDALNSRIHRFIALREAGVAPLAKPQQLQRVAHLLVDLNQALLVTVLEEPDPPADFVAPSPPRDTQPMMFFTPLFAIRADFYKRSDMEISTMLSEMTDDFIALSSVAVFPLGGGATLQRSFVCLNRNHVHALFAVAAPPPATPPPPPVEVEAAPEVDGVEDLPEELL